MFRKKWYIPLCTGFAKITGCVPALVFYKPRVILAPGAERRLPKPCILVSNHRSLLDFPLYLTVFPFRTIRFPAAEVLFRKNKFLSGLLYALGCIRVDREGKSFDFVSEAIAVLDGGGTLGIFPEGRLPVNGKPFPFTASTAFIASHAEAPIVPVYTDGSYGLNRRTTVVIGKPFTLTDHRQEGLNEEQQLEHLTQVLRKSVYELQGRIP